ncbi:hypothetical protein SAMN04487948_104335 [Halogranum amylolyticum]|uniref:Uncharacterized protein n=1 Tax=Halogranum amylolyticum TaxID=660520 RepID=A0A1H8RZK8_9EURY|nr:hypothetical protein [Halogranum amylolyticum]SEO71644.1 hypothetical protein SAMN04487948_104335 [Halogranum amylolyticum]
MNSLGALARLAIGVVSLLAVGAVVALVVGLLSTQTALVPASLVVALVILVVGGLTRLGIRGTDRTETPYW